MQLFQLRHYKVIIEPQALMIKEFAAVRESNKGDEEMTLKELSYMWFTTDVRSSFQNIIDDKERGKEVKTSISLAKSWKPSKTLLAAMKFYSENSKTPSSGLYDATMISVKFIENKLRNPGKLLEEVDGKGAKVYKLDTLLRMIKDIPDVMVKLHKARQQVIKELESKTNLKGGKAKSIFEDGIGEG